MTEQHYSEQAQREIDELKAELAEQRESHKSVRDFLARLSHGIRTSMQGINGMARLLLETQLDQEQREYAETIIGTSDGLKSTIGAVLDLTRIEKGELKLDNLEFDLRRMVRGVDQMARMAASEKGLAYISHIDSEVPTRLRGDPGRIRQVLLNLLNNAVSYTERGKIRLSISLVTDNEEKSKVHFEVSDEGPGIDFPVNWLLKAFTPREKDARRHGMGLGLPMSAELVALMGGKLELDTPNAGGTRVNFDLVFQKATMKMQGGKERSEELRGMRVLVVDPDRMGRYVAKSIARLWGCVPEGAAGAVEALEKIHLAAIAGQPYTTVIVDQFISEMEPEELGHIIKADRRNGETSLVLIAGNQRAVNARTLRKAGYLAYLAKPVTSVQLYECLRLAIETKKKRSVASRLDGRVLLVEDNVVNRRVAERILEKAGCEVDYAENGEAGIEALRKRSYDLVLMDVQMPDMDGLEVTRIIRDPNSSVMDHSVPVIAMTAHAMDGDRERCLAAGMNDYVSKPIETEAFVNLMEKWLKREKERKSENSAKNSVC